MKKQKRNVRPFGAHLMEKLSDEQLKQVSGGLTWVIFSGGKEIIL